MATLPQWRAGRGGVGFRWWGGRPSCPSCSRRARARGAGRWSWPGPPGVGKTRLLDELAERVTASGVVLRGAATAGGGPYRPLAEALLRAAPPAIAEHERLTPFRAVLARLLPTWPAAPAAREYIVDPVVVLGEAVLELLRVVAEDRRCVALLDDLHWADPETLRLLEYLAPLLDGEPVVLVCAARDDESSPVRTLHRRLDVLPLRRLRDDDVATLARPCADGPVSDDLTQLLTTAADGLPLLVEELFAGLVEDGRVHRDALGWRSSAPLAVRVPEAFADVVRQRLDRLRGHVGDLVQTAAVLGGEPDWRLIAAASGVEPGRWRPPCASPSTPGSSSRTTTVGSVGGTPSPAKRCGAR